MRSPNEAVPIQPDQLSSFTRTDLQAHAMAGYIEARVIVDGMVVGTGVGQTLGEAVMVAGAMMCGSRVTPPIAVELNAAS